MNVFYIVLTSLLLVGCQNNQNSIAGSYLLLESTTIKGKDTIHTTVDSTKTEMIKILNETHFSFHNHDRNKGQDSTALFVSGAGRFNYHQGKYTEYLDYCSYRPWEGKTFHFSLTFHGDTLIQEGIEAIPELKINQYIIEKYVRIK